MNIIFNKNNKNKPVAAWIDDNRTQLEEQINQ